MSALSILLIVASVLALASAQCAPISSASSDATFIAQCNNCAQIDLFAPGSGNVDQDVIDVGTGLQWQFSASDCNSHGFTASTNNATFVGVSTLNPSLSQDNIYSHPLNGVCVVSCMN
jgi:hypothetical protein